MDIQPYLNIARNRALAPNKAISCFWDAVMTSMVLKMANQGKAGEFERAITLHVKDVEAGKTHMYIQLKSNQPRPQ